MDYDYYLVTLNIKLKGEKMKVNTRRFLTIIILGLFVFVMTSEVCNAQYSRSGKSEIYGMIQTMDSTDASATGVKLDFDSTTVYGFGFGSNLTDHWNVNTDLLFGSTDIDVSGSRATATAGDTDYVLWDINVDYNIMTERLTPLVTAGIGLFNMNGDYNNGNSFSETNFSYNLGAGGRWDITDNILVKLLYRITWTKIEDTDDTCDFSGISLSVAYMF
jgi:opacity protein-like surface antigen